VIALLEREVGLGPVDVSYLDVRERFTLVDVPEVAAEEAVDRLCGARIRGRRVLARRDRAAAGAV
jgi:ATP-dependent RNA helicase DeaD